MRLLGTSAREGCFHPRERPLGATLVKAVREVHNTNESEASSCPASNAFRGMTQTSP